MEEPVRADDVIDRYVKEVAGHLPIKLRADVSMEITSLLRDDLDAKAAAAGRAADPMLASEVVEAYGDPREVANRYHPRWAIIDPVDTRGFFMAVIIGFIVLVVMSVPTALLTPEKVRDYGTILMWWTGLVTAFYAVKSWHRRRWPKKYRWNPNRDPDRVTRVGLVAIILGIGISIALFAEPQRMFAWLTGGWRLASSFDYDPMFRAGRLPWLFGVWIGHALVLAIVAVRGRWNPLLRRIQLLLTAAIVVLFAWYRADGPVMAESVPNATVKAFMAMIALLLLVDIALRLYRQAGHAAATAVLPFSMLVLACVSITCGSLLYLPALAVVGPFLLQSGSFTH
jgi:hypothetical protein